MIAADRERGDLLDREHPPGEIRVPSGLVGHDRRGGPAAVVVGPVALGAVDVRRHPHRAQHGHADPVRSQLPGEDLGQRDDAVLGDAVRAETDVRHEPGERRREQHVATLALVDDPGEERLDAVDRSPQVDVDDPPPVVVGHLGHWPADRHPGVVEHDVHRAEHGERLVGQPLHRRERPDVARHAVGFDTSGPQPVDGARRARPPRRRPARHRAPRSPSWRAVASPIPLAPPVITAPAPRSSSTVVMVAGAAMARGHRMASFRGGWPGSARPALQRLGRPHSFRASRPRRPGGPASRDRSGRVAALLRPPRRERGPVRRTAPEPARRGA